MKTLEDIQKILDSHVWGDTHYATGHYGDKPVRIPYRKCVDCKSYDSLNSVQACNAVKYCEVCSHAVHKSSAPDNKCTVCQTELTRIPAHTVLLPTV
jgi:hypothetical protein